MSLSKDGPDGWFVRAVARLLCLMPGDVRVSLKAEPSNTPDLLFVTATVEVKRGPRAPWEALTFEFNARDAGGRSPSDLGIQPWTVEHVTNEAAGQVLARLARGPDLANQPVPWYTDTSRACPAAAPVEADRNARQGRCRRR